MPESKVFGQPQTLAGGGGGGQSGKHDDWSKTGDPPDNDMQRLARMIERIGFTLNNLVRLKPKLLPELLEANFADAWPEVQQHVSEIVGILRSQITVFVLPNDFLYQLQQSGLTGPMLRMKEASLYFHLNGIDANLEAYRQVHSKTDKPILTYPESKGIVETVFGLLKPGMEVMNSVLGSLPGILPGKEVVKEFKEHLGAGYAVGEHLAKQRETK